MSCDNEQVVAVEVDVKAEEGEPDASDAQTKPEAEGETPAAAEPQQEQEPAAAPEGGEDSGSDDEKEAPGI